MTIRDAVCTVSDLFESDIFKPYWPSVYTKIMMNTECCQYTYEPVAF